MALAPSGILHAQVAGGAMSGAVTDSTGAALESAEITVTNKVTGVVRKSFANARGVYSLPNLAPGPYEASASVEGFSTLVKSGITMVVGGQLQLNFRLKPGDLSERIRIPDAAPTVELTSATSSAVINDTVVRELPLNGRDWTALAPLQPGVATVRTQPPIGIGNQRPNRGLGTQFTIGGNRPQQNNYRVDGISINDYSNGAPGSVLAVDFGVDAVQEFSVLTGNAMAEYGRSSGGIINAATRSGTNGFHGAGYEFLRNSALDTRNFFEKGTPPFRRNQFGGSIGGPIRKDRTFFFADYEGLRQSLGTNQLAIVPSAAAHAGQLSAGPVTVDSRVQPYLNFYPLPNGAVNGNTGIYAFESQQETRETFFTARGDHRFRAVDTLSGTYFFDDGQTSGPDTMNAKITAALSRRQMAGLAETHLFSSALSNSIRAGFSRVVSISPTTLGAINPLAKDTSLGFVPGLPAGLINVAGLTNFPGGLGAGGEYDFHFNSWQVYDDAFWTHGAHQVKFGAFTERIQANQLGIANPNGQFIFGSLANFLTNKPTSFNAPLSGAISTRDLRTSIAGFYVHDDYRLRPNLTLNLGLRYEFSTVPTETAGRLSTLVNVTDATPHLGSPYFRNPTRKNFEPRIGLVWDPFGSGKTAVRSAVGVYDVLPLPYQFEINSLLSAPFFEQGSVTGLADGVFPAGAFVLLRANNLRYSYIEQNARRNYVLQWKFDIEREIRRGLLASVGYAGAHGTHNLFRDDDMNIVLPAATPQGYLWPSPAGSGRRLNASVGRITGLMWGGSSVYHALQTQLVKRWSRGLQFGASYTWSKSLDDGSASVVGDAFANSVSSLPFFDSKLRRSLADFDIRHNLALNFTWNLPGPGGPGMLSGLTKGWTLGGIYQLSSGLPFTPLIGGDPLGLNSSDTFAFPDRLNLAGCNSPVNPGKPSRYINTSCFAVPSLLTRLGNAGRNVLIGPGLSNLDASLFKDFYFLRISETFHAQFRMEVFNAMNHSNFAPPLTNRTLFSVSGAPIAAAGAITATSTPSRQAQVALKLIF